MFKICHQWEGWNISGKDGPSVGRVAHLGITPFSTHCTWHLDGYFIPWTRPCLGHFCCGCCFLLNKHLLPALPLVLGLKHAGRQNQSRNRPSLLDPREQGWLVLLCSTASTALAVAGSLPARQLCPLKLTHPLFREKKTKQLEQEPGALPFCPGPLCLYLFSQPTSGEPATMAAPVM